MEAAENKNTCPICHKVVDDDHFLPIADKCADCYLQELTAFDDEWDNMFPVLVEN